LLPSANILLIIPVNDTSQLFILPKPLLLAHIHHLLVNGIYPLGAIYAISYFPAISHVNRYHQLLSVTMVAIIVSPDIKFTVTHDRYISDQFVDLSAF
jgi:hypothetical protein